MNRRQVLALLAAAGTAGCLSDFESGSSTSRSETTNRDTSTDLTTVPPTTAETTPEQTTTAEPPTVGVSDPAECPSFDDDVVRVVCSPDTDAPLAFESTNRSGTLPRAEFEFTLTNETNATFQTNFYAWRVWKRVDGEWYHVAPRMWPDPLMAVRPGESHTWSVSVDNADLDRPIPRAEGTSEVTVVGLGAGEYAFGVDGWFQGQHYEDGTGVAVPFELTGDPLELTAIGIDRVERDGDAVRVYADPDEGEDPAAYVLTRVDDTPTEPRRMITEQVLRDTPLRNALAHFEPDVRRVRLETGTTTYPPFGVDEPRYVRYEGETYSIEAERLADETTET